MMTERDEHAIWDSRWEGRKVTTPDGHGVCCGFADDRTGISYQVRTVNPEGVTTWHDFPKKVVKLVGKEKR